MAQKFSTVLLDIRVEPLLLLHVPVVDPRCDYPQTTQFATVFMRYEVIRVVVTDSNVWKRTLRFAWNKLAGQNAVAAIGQLRNRLEHLGQVLPCQFQIVRDRELLRANVCDVV